MFTICSACGSDWCKNCECVRQEMQDKIDKLAALLLESKREHRHCDDSWYCCRACRCEDHGLVENEHLQKGYDLQPKNEIGTGVCTCGAAAWNKRVDEMLS